MTVLQGLSAFPITPADADGTVQTGPLQRVLDRLLRADIDSIGLLGSTGGFAYLDRTQRRRAIAAAKEVVGGRLPLLVGIGALRADHAVQFARDAEAEGADALLLPALSYLPLTDRDVFALFQDVSGASDRPIVVYNNPITTGVTIGQELLVKLAELPRVVAVKNPGQTQEKVAAEIAALRPRLPEGFSLGHSGDALAAQAQLGGSQAWYSVLGGLFPQPCLDIIRAARSGDAAATQAAHERLQPLWALFAELGSIRLMYASAQLLGLSQADLPRPLLPLEPQARNRLAAVLEQLSLR